VTTVWIGALLAAISVAILVLTAVVARARREQRQLRRELARHDERLADVRVTLSRAKAAHLVESGAQATAADLHDSPGRPQLRVIRGGKSVAWIPGLALGSLAARSKAFAAGHPTMAAASVTMVVTATVGAGYALHETVTGPGGGAASHAWSPSPGSTGPAPVPAPRRPQSAAPAAPGGERDGADVASPGSVAAVVAGLHGGQPERPHDHGPPAAQPQAPRTGDEDGDVEPLADPEPDVPILDPKRPGDVEVTVPELPQTMPEVVGELPGALPEALPKVPADDLRKITESKIETCFRECFSQLPTPSHPGS
jgi:hypothetical protein